ncbi:MAG: MBL fold metallo-hydrolase [Dehalococcoidales bacterium]|nr:MAG: MBL fold metallo-hydrolase [Dehalococcoidales bacterium]
MNLTFLGTGAAPSNPLPFCRCNNCQQARELGGRSFRKRSSLLVNNDLIIDLGPDIMSASLLFDVDLSSVRYCLQTHPHGDHFDISNLFSRHPEYAPVDVPPLSFYASAVTLQQAAKLAEDELLGAKLLDPIYCQQLNLEIHKVEPLRPFDVGHYKVIAFPANHGPETSSLLYSVSADGQTIFYGTDTAQIPEETWKGFHLTQIKFNIVILDHTYGLGFARDDDHLNAAQFIDQVARMRNEGILADNARILATHISHEGNPVHPELSKYAAKNGYEIAYDGLSI